MCNKLVRSVWFYSTGQFDGIRVYEGTDATGCSDIKYIFSDEFYNSMECGGEFLDVCGSIPQIGCC